MITIDDIPYELQAMVNLIGFDDFLQISKLYGGGNIYIPVYNKVIMGERNRQIANSFNGKNIKELKQKYNLTANQIKSILKKQGKL